MANEFQHKSVGSTITQGEFEATDGGGHIFDSQATGDIAYASSATVLSRLGIGSSNAVLIVSGGVPAWSLTPTLTTVDAATDFTVGDLVITDGVLTDSTGLALAANVTVTGNILPNADDTYDLGSASAAWQDIFLEGDITMSDAGTLATSAGGLTITSAAAASWTTTAGALTITGAAASTWGTGAGALTLSPATDVLIANGKGLVVGHTGQETISIGDGATDLVPEVQVLGTGQVDGSLMLGVFSTTATAAGAPLVAMVKGGNATIGSHTVVTDGEELGNIIAYGDDGTDLEAVAAQIQFEVDGTPGTGDMPGRIILATTADGAEVATERVRISSAGLVTVTGELSISGSALFDSTPSDETVSGITATFTAGEDLVRGEVVYFKASDSKMWKAVATAAATSRCVAMCAADVSADAAGTFLMHGFLADNGSFPSYTIGGVLFTPEAETSSQNVPEQAAPDTDGDFVQTLGWAVTANSVYFCPSLDVIEHA